MHVLYIINVLAHKNESKYAIPGSTLAPVGGFVELNEAPFDAAKREVKEELGLGSQRTYQRIQNDIQQPQPQEGDDNKFLFKLYSDTFDKIPKMARAMDPTYGLAKGTVSDDEPDWIFLGRYRTAANRGGGFLYSYLLKDAVPILPNGGTPQFVSIGDDESQQLVHIPQRSRPM